MWKQKTRPPRVCPMCKATLLLLTLGIAGCNVGSFDGDVRSVAKRIECQTNLQTLSSTGFTDLAAIFENAGYEMGGELQNAMDALQGIGAQGWSAIRMNWNQNGGFPQGMPAKVQMVS